jgi:hypothetical protein
MKKTMVGGIGMTPPTGVPAAGPAPGAPGSMKKTMVGISPGMTPPTGVPAAEPPQQLPPSQPPPATHMRTMLGMPAIAPPKADPAAPGLSTVTGLPSPIADVPPSFPDQRVPGHKRTMLGVAIPGIAPLAPGVPKEPSRSSYPPPVGPTSQAVAPVPYSATAQSPYAPSPPGPYEATRDASARPSSRPPPKRRTHGSALIALFGGLVLAAGAAAFALLWRSPAPLRAEARVDSAGTDLLHITCATCPDGTELRIGEVKGKIASNTVDLALPAPLKVGSNTFAVDIDRPANGRDEKVSLVVKIGYRIRPDLSQLGGERAILRVAIEGAPGASMTIDTKPLVLGSDGRGSYDVDITSDCTGVSDEAKMIDRNVSYSVVGTSGAAEQGVVGMRVAVPVLHVDAPVAHTVVEADHVLLAGRTGKGARLSAGSVQVPVLADGGFSKQLPLAAIGENQIQVRTLVPGQAPRSTTLRVKRVEHLADEARDFSSKAPLTFSDLTANIAGHIGQPIVLSGEVAEARVQGPTNVMLVDVQKGCARSPCLARVVAPSDQPLARADHVQVYGHVTRAVGATPATAAPEIESDFIIKKH